MKKHKKLLFFPIVLLLCIMLLLALQTAVRLVEKAAYPQKYSAQVQQYAFAYQVEPALVYAIIRTESGFKKDALSSVGARGLMQITEETFSWIKSKIAQDEEISFDDLYDPTTNIRFGTYLLSVCMARYDNDISTAAAAYHSGLGKVDSLLADESYTENGKVLHTFPYNQMNNYVRKVMRNYKMYQTLYAE